MRPFKEIETRLKAENKACEVDPTLYKNNFVRGIVEALTLVDSEVRKSYTDLDIDIDDFVEGMIDALNFVKGENKF